MNSFQLLTQRFTGLYGPPVARTVIGFEEARKSEYREWAIQRQMHGEGWKVEQAFTPEYLRKLGLW